MGVLLDRLLERRRLLNLEIIREEARLATVQERLAKKIEKAAVPRESLPQKIVDVARTLPEVFTREDLAVALFKADPDRWALAGFPHLLNSHAVWGILSHRCGPVKKGLIQRLGGGRYKVV